MSQPVYSQVLNDDREVWVIEWEVKGRTFRETVVYIPDSDESSASFDAVGPFHVTPALDGDADAEIRDRLMDLRVPSDVVEAVINVIRSGRRNPPR